MPGKITFALIIAVALPAIVLAQRPWSRPTGEVTGQHIHVDFSGANLQRLEALGAVLAANTTAVLGAKATWSSCGVPSDLGHITSGTYTPNPIVKGTPFTFSGSGPLTASVSSGTYSVVIKFDGIPILSHSGPVCGKSTFNLPLGLGPVNVNGLSCPAKPGPVTISELIPYSSSAPSGSVSVHITAADSSNKRLLCLDCNFAY